MITKNVSSFVGRRAELIAELFLQELHPAFLVQPTPDLGYDFLVGVPNTKGGVNNFAVQVKGTENPIQGPFRIETKLYTFLAYSNIPAMLLVVDVKNNQLYYAWISPGLEGTAKARTVSIRLTEIDDAVQTELRLEVRRRTTEKEEMELWRQINKIPDKSLVKIHAVLNRINTPLTRGIQKGSFANLLMLDDEPGFATGHINTLYKSLSEEKQRKFNGEVTLLNILLDKEAITEEEYHKMGKELLAEYAKCV